MKISIGRLGIALIVLLACPLGFAQQAPGVHTLVKRLDHLATGELVTHVSAVSIGDDGTWAAIVGLGGAPGRAVIVDGAILHKDGDVLADGETFVSALSVSVSRQGKVGVMYRAQEPGGGTQRRYVRIDGQLVLAEAEIATFAALGLSGTVFQIHGFDYDHPALLLALSMDDPGSGVRQVLVRGTMGASGFTATDGFIQGDAVPGLTGTFRANGDQFFITPNQRTTATITTLVAGNIKRALVASNAGVAQDGLPAPPLNSTWTGGIAMRGTTNTSGMIANAGSVLFGNGSTLDVLYVGSTAMAVETVPLNSVPFDPVGSLANVVLRLSNAGELAFACRFASGTERLIAGDDTLLTTGVTTIDGVTLSTLFPQDAEQRTDATSDGRTLVQPGLLGPVNVAALVVERDITEPVSCTSNPNSTGQVGQLGASGSRYVHFNDLTLTATDLPPQVFGLLVCSMFTGFTPMAGGSDGVLCLGGMIGRFNDQISLSSPSGSIELDIDLTSIPQPNSIVAIQPGSTWFFQLWHRDLTAGMQSSNYTNPVAVRFW